MSSLKQKIIQICKDFSNEIGTDKKDGIYDFGKVVIIRNKGRDYVYLKSDFIISLLREGNVGNERRGIKMKELYQKLRQLISDNYSISIIDSERYNNMATVGVSSRTDEYHWTRFKGQTIEDAFKRAIEKFEHPDQDYKDETGHVWKASEESCFSEKHIRSFLKGKVRG